jgi:hypothetical protein
MAASVAEVAARLRERLDTLPPTARHRAPFLGAYLRTTEAVGSALRAGLFEDAAWVERWDVAFAEFYLAAHDADLSGDLGAVTRPWRLAFSAPAELPALRHVLLGINAHVNYDLPQAMLAVIGPQDFTEPDLLARRRRDHERIDTVLASRVKAEDTEIGDRRSVVDRALTPLNRLASTWPSSIPRGCSGMRPTAPGWPSSRCSARHASRTCWRPGRCCCGWRSRVSA